MEGIKLGRGVLSWDASERISDRYGTVWLLPEGVNSLIRCDPISLIQPRAEWEGSEGELIAVVTEARDSTHVGDLFHGVSPETPEVGEIIVLGDGQLFFETGTHGGFFAGLRPLDQRSTLWLDIRKLYRAHEQSVELFFHPTKRAWRR